MDHVFRGGQHPNRLLGTSTIGFGALEYPQLEKSQLCYQSKTCPRRTWSSRVHQCESGQAVHSLTRKSAMTTGPQRLSNWPVTKALSNVPLPNHNLHLQGLITADLYLPLAMLSYTHYRSSKRFGYSLSFLLLCQRVSDA